MRRRSTMVILVCACVVAAACGGGSGRGFEIGLERIAVDLSFSDLTKAPPPVVVSSDVILAAPSPPTAPGFTTAPAPEVIRGAPVPTLRKPAVPCPKADADAHPDTPVRVFATTDPAAGTYTTHNEGKVTFGVGPTAITLGYPQRGLFTIRNIRHGQTSDAVNGTTTQIIYDVVEVQIDGAEVTTTYQTTNTPSSLVGQAQRTSTLGPQPLGALELVKQVRRDAGGTREFNPRPAVTIMAFRSGEGTSWSSAGIDPDSGTSLAVQGQIESRELVDVCGTIYDTYRVRSTERYTNLGTGFSSQTDPQDPNIYNVATQLGGLFISRHVSTTTTTPGSEGAANQLVLRYTSVLDSATPQTAG